MKATSRERTMNNLAPDRIQGVLARIDAALGFEP